MDVGVAVGDESLHAVQAPCAVGLLGGLEHHALQVRAGIGLGEVHRHSLALADAGDEAGLLLFVGKLIDGLGTILQTPEILESGVGAADDVGGHDIGSDGEVETAEATGHGHAHEAGLAASLEILFGLVGIDDAVVLHAGTLMVYVLGVGGDDVAADLAYYLEHAVV